MYIRRNKSKTENGGHGSERVEIDARLVNQWISSKLSR